VAEPGTDNNTEADGSDGPPEMKPAGYFEGESMTRRKAFTVASQAIGGVAGAVVILPALGFAVAPVFERPEEIWQAVGTVDDFPADTYTSVVITIVEGIGEAGKSTAYVRRGT
jgi:menaquinol-cytochrome c reductase iron-sulfur subunit